MQNFTKFLTLFCLTLIGFRSVAQQDIHVAGGQFYVSGALSVNRLEADLFIENRNINDIAVLVDRDISQQQPFHHSYYCWAQCYDTTVSLSPDYLVMPGNWTDSSSFHSYLYTGNRAGLSKVVYKFYDKDNPTDTALAEISYDVLNTGISPVERSLYQLSSPSPNPANNMTSFTYNTPVPNTKLMVRDLLGNVVAEYNLGSTKGMIMIPVTELASGIYTCSIVTNGSSISTSKLVVSHR